MFFVNIFNQITLKFFFGIYNSYCIISFQLGTKLDCFSKQVHCVICIDIVFQHT